jgi:hypothetical protein
LANYWSASRRRNLILQQDRIRWSCQDYLSHRSHSRFLLFAGDSVIGKNLEILGKRNVSDFGRDYLNHVYYSGFLYLIRDWWITKIIEISFFWEMVWPYILAFTFTLIDVHNLQTDWFLLAMDWLPISIELLYCIKLS